MCIRDRYQRRVHGVPYRPDDETESETKQSISVSNIEKADSTKETAKSTVEVKTKKVDIPLEKEERGSTPPKENRIIFKIQILTSGQKLKVDDKRFKGLTPVDFYSENETYKYTYGASENYNEVLQTKKKKQQANLKMHLSLHLRTARK
eukprot:TRINITY_DN5952_c0_g1_i2.p3 TRINITY_DN5952_c0_g1~~TRINITY_DN5952_c0_g1_i2.p3  ORF type:complete len:149 (+),score=23.99 TRINITY_DN5952_c0_g1_i2:110-556(+)